MKGIARFWPPLLLFSTLLFPAAGKAGASAGSAATVRSVVLFPFQAGSPETEQAAAVLLTEALQTALQETGRYEVLLFHPRSLLVRQALADKVLTEYQLAHIGHRGTPLAVARALRLEAALRGKIMAYAFTLEPPRATSRVEVDIDIQEAAGNRVVAFRATAEAQIRIPRASSAVRLASEGPETDWGGRGEAAQRKATAAVLARRLVERIEEYWPVLPPKEKPGAAAPGPTPGLRPQETWADPLAEARSRAQAGEFSAASRAYTAAIAADPGNVALYVELGDMLATAGRWEEALNQYERAIRVDDQYLPAHRRRAQAYHHLQRPAEEIEAWRQLIALGEGGEEIERALAEAYLANNDYQQGVALYERLLGTTDDPYPLRLKLARLAEERQELEAAQAHYEAALALRPRDPAAYEQLLAFHIRQHQPGPALARLQELLQLTEGAQENRSLSEDLYFPVLHLLDREAGRLRQEFEELLETTEPRGSMIQTLEKLDQRGQDLLALADRIPPRQPYRRSFRHRTLAYSLLNQAVVEYLQYLDTGESLSRERSLLLLQQSREELNTAQRFERRRPPE